VDIEGNIHLGVNLLAVGKIKMKISDSIDKTFEERGIELSFWRSVMRKGSKYSKNGSWQAHRYLLNLCFASCLQLGELNACIVFYFMRYFSYTLQNWRWDLSII